MKKQRFLPTADQVRSRLDYDPETGAFKWKTVSPMDFSGPHAERFSASRNAQLRGKSPGYLNDIGYVEISLFGVRFTAHILAMIYMGVYEPGKMVDHINGVKSDNRFKNLRMVTPKQNQTNRIGSGQVEYDKEKKRWAARATVNGRLVRLGRHRTKGLAMLRYAKWSLQHHGKHSVYYRNAEKALR